MLSLAASSWSRAPDLPSAPGVTANTIPRILFLALCLCGLPSSAAASLEGTAEAAEGDGISLLLSLVSQETERADEPTADWQEYQLFPSLAASKSDLQRGLLFSFTSAGLQSIRGLGLPQMRGQDRAEAEVDVSKP